MISPSLWQLLFRVFFSSLLVIALSDPNGSFVFVWSFQMLLNSFWVLSTVAAKGILELKQQNRCEIALRSIV